MWDRKVVGWEKEEEEEDEWEDVEIMSYFVINLKEAIYANYEKINKNSTTKNNQ